MIYFLFFLTVCLFFLIVFVYANIFYTLYLKVPMLSTSDDVIKKILENIDFAKVKKFYDLGSGNGKVISQIAKCHPEIACVGIELNFVAYCLAKIRNIFLKQKVKFQRKDFFKVDLSDADVVYAYLFPEVMNRLEIKFAKELKKGALVIDGAFPLKNKHPKKIITGKSGALDTLYVYEY